MTGGTIEGNESEGSGGGIFIQTNCTANITKGSIINNTCHGGDYGGGGIYANGVRDDTEDGRLYLNNVLITGNTAEETGGGFAGCCTSTTYIYMGNGAALYGNGAGDDSDIHIGTEYHVTSWGLQSGVPFAFVSQYMFNGTAYNWKDSVTGEVYTPAMLANICREASLRAYPDGEVPDDALVIITGNHSDTKGGGVGSNGFVCIGDAPQPMVVKWTPEVDKVLYGRDMKEGETFNFTVYREDTSDGINFWWTKYNDVEVGTGTVNGGKDGIYKNINFTEINMGEMTVEDLGRVITYLVVEDRDDRSDDVTYPEYYLAFDVIIGEDRDTNGDIILTANVKKIEQGRILPNGDFEFEDTLSGTFSERANNTENFGRIRHKAEKAEFVNIVEYTCVKVVKVWKDVDGNEIDPSTLPEGTTVTLQLYADGKTYVRRPDYADPIKLNPITLDGDWDYDGEDNPWMAVWDYPALPIYRVDNNGQMYHTATSGNDYDRVVYTVVEIANDLKLEFAPVTPNVTLEWKKDRIEEDDDPEFMFSGEITNAQGGLEITKEVFVSRDGEFKLITPSAADTWKKDYYVQVSTVIDSKTYYVVLNADGVPELTTEQPTGENRLKVSMGEELTLSPLPCGVYTVKEISSDDELAIGGLKYEAKLSTTNANVTVEPGALATAALKNYYGNGRYCVAVTKRWDDDNNRDGVRPVKLYVELLRDGEKQTIGDEDYAELNAANNWTAMVRGVELYNPDNGKYHEYTWKEFVFDDDGTTRIYPTTDNKITFKLNDERSGVYTVSNDGVDTKDDDNGIITFITKLTNSYTPETVNVTANKVWAGEPEGFDALRKTITLRLEGSYEAEGTTYYLTDSGLYTPEQQIDANGKAEWKDLPKYCDGHEITYKVVEVDVPEGYQVSYSQNGGKVAFTGNKGTVTVTNTLQKGGLTITKRMFVNDDEVTNSSEKDTVKAVYTKQKDKVFYVRVYTKINNVTWYVTADNGLLSKVEEDAKKFKVTLSAPVTISDLPVGTYTIEEVVDLDGNTIGEMTYVEALSKTEDHAHVEVGGTAKAEVINKYTSGRFCIAVTKQWMENGEVYADDDLKLEVTLTRGIQTTAGFVKDNEFRKTFTLYKDNNWSAVAVGMEQMDANGNRYIYTWTEGSHEGWAEGSQEEVQYNGSDADSSTMIFLTKLTNSRVDAEIPVKKTVTGDAYEGAFEFKLKGPDGEPAKIVDDTIELSNGESGKFVLKGFTVPGVYEYTVKETEGNEPGVTYDKTEKKVTVTIAWNKETTKEYLTATVSASESAPVEFTNEYGKTSFTPEVKKAVTGMNAPDEEFTFQLKDSEDNVIDTKTAKANGTAVFDDLVYHEAGTYNYTITEKAPDTKTAGIGYTAKEIKLTVTVTAAEDGALTASGEYKLDDVIGNTLTNTYAAEGKTQIEAAKRLTGRTLAADEFTFTVEGTPARKTADADYTAEELTVKNDATGKVTFPAFYYDERDIGKTYVYTVKETEGSEAGVTYDQSVYTVQVTITGTGTDENSDGKEDLAVKQLIIKTKNENGEAWKRIVDEITFANTYEAAGEITVEASKTLSGRALKNGEFTFTLTGEGQNQSKSNVEANVVFDAIKYTEADIGKTYTYTVKEEQGVLGGVTYDVSEYTVTVSVAASDKDEDHDGKADLIITKTIKKGDADADEIAFANTYEATGSITFAGTKTLTGRAKALQNEEFSFQIKEGKTVKFADITHSADGKIAYPTIGYTLKDVGTHTYTVSETSTNGNGVTVDITEYTVTVTVSDNGDGTLKVEASDNYEALNFVNTYYADTEVQFTATKKLTTETDRTLKAGEFTFELRKVLDGDKREIIERKTNDADGKVTFSKIKYTNADAGVVHKYEIVEIRGNDGTITYDTHTEEITVNVSDDNKGTLTAVVTTDRDVSFENKYETTESTITKVWDDGENQKNKRPDTIKVKLLANNILYKEYDLPTKEGAAVTEVANGTYTWDATKKTWSLTVSKLPLYDINGAKQTYTWLEDVAVEGYTISKVTVTENSTTITNKYDPERFCLTVLKVWDDGDNRDNKRPVSVTLHLLANGEAAYAYDDGVLKKVPDVVLNESNNWTGMVMGLPIYKDGKEIVYTWTEEAVTGYEAPVFGNLTDNKRIFTVTNKYTPEETEVTVAKVWHDANNQDGIRAESVTVELLANGAPVKEIVLNEGNSWTYTFEHLPKNEKGAAIKYSVREINVPDGYEVKYTVGSEEIDSTAQVSGKTVTISNKHVPEVTKVTVKKFWDDASNQDGKREGVEAKVQLQKTVGSTTSDVGDPVTVGAADGWSNTWTGLPVNENGKQITYSVVETLTTANGYALVGYAPETLAAVKDDSGEITITNNYTPETTTVAVKKVWNDANNQDGKRESVVAFAVLSKTVGSLTTELEEVRVGAEDNWTYSWAGLPVYEHGSKITYSVEEKVLTANGYTFKGYTPANSAEAVNDATFEVTLTNEYTPEVTQVTAKKFWDDASNQDGKRADVKATVQLQKITEDETEFTNVGTAVLVGAEDTWSKTWSDLPVYQAGKKITYRVEETVTKANGYGRVAYEPASLTAASGDSGAITIKNPYTPEKINIPVTKIWDDISNEFNKRPESVTVELLADGEPVRQVVLTKANEESRNKNNWSYTFENLDKYRDEGIEIIYTVREVNVPYGYTVAYSKDADGTLLVTNTHYEAYGDITFLGTKVLSGRKMNAGEFSFKIEEAVGTERKLIATAKNSIAGNVSPIDYPKIEYTLDDVGRHTYIITESEAIDGNVKIDGFTHTITVNVSDEPHNGHLVVTPSDNYQHVDFVNTYEASGSYTLQASKMIQGREFAAGDEWTFTITAVTPGAPMPEVNAVTVKPTSGSAVLINSFDTTGKFGLIKFTQDHVDDDGNATYEYKITESGTVKNVRVEEAEKNVTLTVRTVIDDATGKKKLEVTSTADTAPVTFNNIFENEVTIPLKAFKKLEGREFIDSDEWTFTLTPLDDEAPMPKDAAGNTVSEVPVKPKDTKGEVDFGIITFTQENTDKSYIYTITESGYVDGVTNDEDERTVTITVTYDRTKQELVAESTSGTRSANSTKHDSDSVRKAKENTVTFTNKYEAKGSITFEGVKTLNGRDLKAGEFTFQIKGDGKTWTATNLDDGTIEYPEIPYTLADVGKAHTYKITEQKGSDTTVIYSTESYTVNVTVTDNKDGTLTATATGADSKKLNFTNTYNAKGSMKLDGTKRMENRAFVDGDVFTFFVNGHEETTLKPAPMPEKTKVTISPKSGTSVKIDFGKINFTWEDIGKTYVYTITEQPTEGDAERYVIHDTPKTVRVTVEDNEDGKLNIISDLEDTPLEFVNTYANKKWIPLEVYKDLEGRDFLEDDEWTFTLTAVTEDAPLPKDDDGNTVSEVTVKPKDTKGEVNFGKITFIKPGTYTYAIIEEPGSVDGVANDKSEKTVTVIVTFDKATNELVVVSSSGTQTDNAKPLSDAAKTAKQKTVTFTNTYEATGEITFAGTKKLLGRDLQEGQFSFSIKENGKTLTTFSHGADGTIAYPTIQYTRNAKKDDVGPHTYEVTETTKDTSDGIKVDKTKYIVTVDVKDNGDGTLDTTDVKVVKVVDGKETKDEVTVDKLDFVNNGATGNITFKGKKTLPGGKDLLGRDIQENEFSFVIKEGSKIVGTAFNDAEGNINYPTINYTLNDVGIHTYTVSEVKESVDPAVSTDTTVYTIRVEVKDNGDGTLKVTPTGDIGKLDFVNTVLTGDLAINKDVRNMNSGAEITNEEFTFVVELTRDGKPVNHKFGDYEFDENGKTTITLQNKGKAVIEGIPVGTQYAVTEVMTDSQKDRFVVSSETTGDVGEITTKNAVVKFVNERLVGDLSIAKSLVTTVETDKDKLFTFHLTLDDKTITVKGTDIVKLENGEEVTYTDSSSKYTASSSHKTSDPIVLKLKDGETVKIKNLPVGVGYTITEVDRPFFENTGKVNDSGKITEAAIAASFTNTRTVLPGDLAVSKTVEGAADDKTSFTFTVTLSGTGHDITETLGEMDFKNGVATFTLKSGETKTATGLPAGVTYTVTENENTNYTTESVGATGTIVAGNLAEARFINTKVTTPAGGGGGGGGGGTRTVATPTPKPTPEPGEETEEPTPKPEEVTEEPTPTPTPVPEKITVQGRKTWDDNNDEARKRPGSITVHLFADSATAFKEVASKTVTAADGWAWSFTDLDKKDDYGLDIEYSIVEDPVPGYTTTYSGTNVTNTMPRELTAATIVKEWDDNNDEEGKRPVTLPVTLLANDVVVKTVYLSGTNDWTITVENLPVYENGERITYTWKEKEVLGYSLTGVSVNGTTITLTNSLYKPATPPPGQNPGPQRGNEEKDIDGYGTPLGLGIIINHVGDCFD